MGSSHRQGEVQDDIDEPPLLNPGHSLCRERAAYGLKGSVFQGERLAAVWINALTSESVVCSKSSYEKPTA